MERNVGPRLSVTISPKTFKAVHEDPVYRDQVENYVLSRHADKSITEVIFCEGEDLGNVQEENVQHMGEQFTELEDVIQSANESTDRRQTWFEAPTKLLLSLIAEFRPQLGKTFQLSNKKKMWNIITDKLSEKGYNFTNAQVEGKFRHLERSFKNVKLNNSKTGRNKMTCRYQSELEEIFSERRGMNPDYILESESVDGVSRHDVCNAVTSNSNNVVNSPDEEDLDLRPSTSSAAAKKNLNEPTPKKRKYEPVQLKLIQSIDKMTRVKKHHYKSTAKGKENFQQQVLELLKQKNARDEEKNERARRKEEMSQQKLELLKQLIDRKKK